MKISYFRVLVLTAALLLGFGGLQLRADDLNAVKARMSQRLSKLDQLKSSGVIGENYRGLLELRGGDADAGDAVAAENRDRNMVYAEIAKQTGTSVDQVAH